MSLTTIIAKHELDTQGLTCPEPIMLLHRTIRKSQIGDIIHVIATDPATTRDIPNFCRHLGHELLQHQEIDNQQLSDKTDSCLNIYHYWIKKN